MSQQLINRNEDLKQLENDGYDIEIRLEKYLLVKNIPYVNSKKEIAYGTLISDLIFAGDETVPPTDHVAYFIGDHPCDVTGNEITQIKHASGERSLAEGLVIQHSFSAKPKLPQETYKNYHHKMDTYVNIIIGPARQIDSQITATIYPDRELSEEESVFKYPETASSRAGISIINKKIELGKVAIIGVGGSGAYVLDLVAKTPVKEIHIFDGDEFLNHNAFRSPGAPSREELRARKFKVAHFAEIYSRMRWQIVPHENYVNAENVDELKGMDFVFLCLDKGADKKTIVEKLREWNKPFIDVGIGVNLLEGDSIMGTVRTTLVTPEYSAHVERRIPFSDGQVNHDYSKNIQIADLNALNAALAVVKWKKLYGYYQDTENEHNSFYSIAGNTLVNEDIDEA